MLCKSILIVEDNDDIRETIQDVLRDEGYRVYAVSNGSEACRALKSIKEPCLIILDMMMPTMNGWEFLAAQKENADFLNQPVVVVSALEARAALRQSVENVNARGYIRKPIDLDAFLEIVQTHCEMPHRGPDEPPEGGAFRNRKEAISQARGVA